MLGLKVSTRQTNLPSVGPTSWEISKAFHPKAAERVLVALQQKVSKAVDAKL